MIDTAADGEPDEPSEPVACTRYEYVPPAVALASINEAPADVASGLQSPVDWRETR